MQPMPQQKLSKKAMMRDNPSSADFEAWGNPFSINDVESKSFRLGYGLSSGRFRTIFELIFVISLEDDLLWPGLSKPGILTGKCLKHQFENSNKRNPNANRGKGKRRKWINWHWTTFEWPFIMQRHLLDTLSDRCRCFLWFIEMTHGKSVLIKSVIEPDNFRKKTHN